MNQVDLVILALVVFFAILGAMSGAILQLSNWIALFVAGFVARPLGMHLGPIIAAKAGVPVFVGIVGLTFVGFFVLYAVTQALLRIVVNRVVKNSALGALDRIGGFALGGIKAAALFYFAIWAWFFLEKPISQIPGAPSIDLRKSLVAQWVRTHDLMTALSFPGLSELRAVVARLSAPQKGAGTPEDPELEALRDDPKLKKLLRDGSISRALESGDPAAILKHLPVLEVLNDPELREKLSRASGGFMPFAGAIPEGIEGVSPAAEPATDKPASKKKR